jgi:hypothetical protein
MLDARFSLSGRRRTQRNLSTTVILSAAQRSEESGRRRKCDFICCGQMLRLRLSPVLSKAKGRQTARLVAINLVRTIMFETGCFLMFSFTHLPIYSFAGESVLGIMAGCEDCLEAEGIVRCENRRKETKETRYSGPVEKPKIASSSR